MPKVDELKIINVDDVPYAVDSLSEQVQGQVALFNEWHQREADAKSDLMLVSAAKETLSRQIITTLRAELEEAKGEGEAETPAETTTSEE